MDYNKILGIKPNKYLYQDSNIIEKEDSLNKIKSLLNDKNLFNAYISKVEKDGKNLYQKDKIARDNKIPNSDFEERQGPNKYKGVKPRILLTGEHSERVCESTLYTKYYNIKHSHFGFSRYYQSPLVRETHNNNDVDIIFNNDEKIYICELKVLDKNGKTNVSIINPISEILTYYYCEMEHIKEDGSDRFFYKAFTGSDYKEDKTYKVIPTILIPRQMVPDEYFTNKLITKLKDLYEFEIGYIEYNEDDASILD